MDRLPDISMWHTSSDFRQLRVDEAAIFTVSGMVAFSLHRQRGSRYKARSVVIKIGSEATLGWRIAP